MITDSAVTIAHCVDCGAAMAYWPHRGRPASWEGLKERGSRERCRVHVRRQRRGPARTGGLPEKASFDELLDCIYIGLHPDDIVARFGYSHREAIYRRLARNGFDEELTTLKARLAR